MLRYSFYPAFKLAAAIIKAFFKGSQPTRGSSRYSLHLWGEKVEKQEENTFPEKGSALFDAYYGIKELE